MSVTTWARVPRQLTLLLLALLLAVAGLASVKPDAAHAALGGPVILGGDDLTDHGSYDGTNNLDGWLYTEKAIANIKPRVTRAGADGSIAALGSTDPGFDPTQTYSGDAGADIASAGAKNAMPVTYYGSEAAVQGFFDALRAGTVKPSIIWIAGNDASNDLGSNGGETALAANATTIGDFVNSGGGLMSHGVEYGWLGGVLPGVTMTDGGSSDDLVLTPQGQLAFPGLTNADVNAGPWHGYFDGDIGGLQVLVTSSTVDDAAGNDARVVIGGAAVTLPGTISLTPTTATNPVGTSHTVTATVRNSNGTGRSGVTVSFAVSVGPGSGATGSATTAADGKASFTYTNAAGPGVDTITASFTDAQVTYSATATKTWVPATAGGSTQGSAEGAGQTLCRYSGSARVNPCWTFRFAVSNTTGAPAGSARVTTPRGRFVAGKVTAVAVKGKVGSFTATGKWRGRKGYTLKATVTDPDEVRFRVFKGKRLVTQTHKAVSPGYVKVTPGSGPVT